MVLELMGSRSLRALTSRKKSLEESFATKTIVPFQVLGILCMSLASPALITTTHWFLFVVVTAFIATLLWSFVYFLGVREVLNLAINWILSVSLSLDQKPHSE